MAAKYLSVGRSRISVWCIALFTAVAEAAQGFTPSTNKAGWNIQRTRDTAPPPPSRQTRVPICNLGLFMGRGKGY